MGHQKILIDNSVLLEGKKSLLEQVNKESETRASITEEEEHLERLAEAYEQSCCRFAESLEQRFPLHESSKPLNIMGLSTQDFIVIPICNQYNATPWCHSLLWREPSK